MTHDGAPGSIVDLILVTIALVVVLISFYLAIRYTLRPGEKSPDHIKRRVLEDRTKESS